MQYNPYGAVPAALENTRQSLRDIMVDMLATKKIEADLSLARSKAETETALATADVERSRIQNLKDVAQLNEISRHNTSVEKNAADTLTEHSKQNLWSRETQFPEEMKFRRENLASEDVARKASAAASLASAGHSRAATAALNEERRQKNMVVSAGDYAGRFGASHMLPMFGVDPEEKRPAWQWEQMGTSLRGFVQQHPAALILSSGHRTKSELEGLSSQYNTPGLDPQTKQVLGIKIGQKLDQLNFIDQMIMNTKEPDVVKVAESARKVWAENPQYQGQYKSYDDFLTDYSNDLKKKRSVFHDDMGSIKMSLATRHIDPDYMNTMKTTKEVIDSLASPSLAKQIKTGADRRMKEKDFAGAYKYQTDWAKYLESTGGKAPGYAPKTSTTPKPTPDMFREQASRDLSYSHPRKPQPTGLFEDQASNDRLIFGQ